MRLNKGCRELKVQPEPWEWKQPAVLLETPHSCYWAFLIFSHTALSILIIFPFSMGPCSWQQPSDVAWWLYLPGVRINCIPTWRCISLVPWMSLAGGVLHACLPNNTGRLIVDSGPPLYWACIQNHLFQSFLELSANRPILSEQLHLAIPSFGYVIWFFFVTCQVLILQGCWVMDLCHYPMLSLVGS